MFIEFNVGNYRSFKDRVTFSMVAANIKSRVAAIDNNNVFKTAHDLSLLTSAAIYGANASGKSNFISAIRFMRQFVLNSSRETQANDMIDVEGFRLNSEMEGKTSFFEIVFIMDNTRYRYGFEVTSQRVVAEWLYYVPTTREAKLFDRHLDTIKSTIAFKESRGLSSKTRSNALFLSVVAQFNGEISKAVLRWFKNLNVSLGLNDMGDRFQALHQFENSKFNENIVKFIKKLDLGIDSITLEKSKVNLSPTDDMPEDLKKILEVLGNSNAEQTTIQTHHRKFGPNGDPIAFETFDLDEHESEGTKKLFALAHPLLSALRNGRVIVIDELDARLHPLITCEIISLFNSQETNPKNAQLIFTTHDTNLLNNRIFRRDQIWFAEKTKQGATHLYSLVEYKIKGGSAVRNDASFEKDYIEGRYGAIPFIGDFRRLIEEDGNNEPEEE